jgi:hypothetical protein
MSNRASALPLQALTVYLLTGCKEAQDAILQWIDGRFNELNIADNDRARIAAGCFDMVLEYQASSRC